MYVFAVFNNKVSIFQASNLQLLGITSHFLPVISFSFPVPPFL